MKIQQLQTLQQHLDHDAYIARELEIRLLEHLSQPIKNEKTLDILRDCSAPMIMEGKFSASAAEFDGIIAHLVPLWQSDLKIFFQEIHHLLSAHGIFLFSTLGTKQAYQLEALGDALVKAGFHLPVVDRESVQLQYDDMNAVKHDLALSGLVDDNIVVLENSPGNVLVELEVIYGYVSGKVKDIADAVEIPVSHITQRERW